MQPHDQQSQPGNQNPTQGSPAQGLIPQQELVNVDVPAHHADELQRRSSMMRRSSRPWTGLSSVPLRTRRAMLQPGFWFRRTGLQHRSFRVPT